MRGSFIVLFLISSCSTHRVFDLNKCSFYKVKFLNTTKVGVKKSLGHKLEIIGDGKDHPLDLSMIKNNSESFNCSRVKEIAFNFKYDWKDTLYSFIPFVSRKTLDLSFVMDDD